jgi:hypothetical protein
MIGVFRFDGDRLIAGDWSIPILLTEGEYSSKNYSADKE